MKGFNVMSGVRFISIVTAIMAIFIWSGFVVNTWQQNQVKRFQMANGLEGAKVGSVKDDAESHADRALARADDIALAASEEFQKISDELRAKGEAALSRIDQKIFIAENLPRRKAEMIALGKAEVEKGETEKVAALSADRKDQKEVEANDKTPAWTVPTAKDPVVDVKVAETSTKVDEPAGKAVVVATDDSEVGEVAVPAGKVAVETTKLAMKEAETPAATVKEKPIWVVPDGATPEYNEITAIHIGKTPWVVPTGRDPIDSVIVGAQITKLADNVKDKAAGAAEKVGEKISSFADGVKDKITVSEKWTVPTGVEPQYEARDLLADGGHVWRVPDAVSPIYDGARTGRDVAMKTPAKSDKLSVATGERTNLIEYLVASNDDAAALMVTSKFENRLRDEVRFEQTAIVKDTARLSKDLKGVPVDKYADTDKIQGDTLVAKGKEATIKSFEGARSEVKSKGAKLVVAALDKKQQSGDKEKSQAKVSETKKPKKEKKNLEQELAEIKEADRQFVLERQRLEQEKLEQAAEAKKEVPVQDGKIVAKLNNSPDEKVASEKPIQLAANETPLEEQKVELEQKAAAKKATKTEKAPEKDALWVVPTGEQPKDSTLTKIERGLDSMKEAAVEAGSEIAETVKDLGASVKDADKENKKWEVPTGVTPDDKAKASDDKDVVVVASPDVKTADEKAPAAKDSADEPVETAKAVKQESADPKDSAVEVADVEAKPADEKAPLIKEVAPEMADVPLPAKKSPLIKGKEVALLDKGAKVDISLPQKRGKEPELFVGAKIQVTKDTIIITTHDDKEAVEAKIASRDNKGKKGTIVKKIINYFADKEETAPQNNEPLEQMSALEEARFGALKKLMVDRVEYKFTNVKKGEGEIEISGRAQQGAKLALYVGPRYLGDVQPDAQGLWSFKQALYLPKNDYFINAQQMSDSGLVLATKSFPLKQEIAARPPEGYDPGLGLGLPKGDTKLAALNEKAAAQKGELPDEQQKAAQIVDIPLPLRKVVSETKKADQPIKAKVEERAVASLEPVSTPPADVKKADKDVQAQKDAETATQKADEVKETSKVEDVPQPVLKGGKVAKVVSPQTLAKTYIVQPGDTLGKIAQAVYGDASRFDEILKLNPSLKSANLIYPKQKLIVRSGDVASTIEAEEAPVEVASVDKKVVVEAVKVTQKETLKKDETTPGPGKTETGAKHYTVVAGDSLWIIAKKVYGNGALYKQLIELNPQLGTNPELIRPDLKLKVKTI